MSIFCPFIKDSCKENNCVMWENSKCLTVEYMRHFTSFREKTNQRYMEREEEVGIPEEIKSANPEELAKKLLAFVKSQSVDGKLTGIDPLFFWQAKGIDKFSAPLEIQLKLRKAEDLYDKYYQDEKAEEERVALKKEEEELPRLTDACVKWAKEKSLKKITKEDVVLFLLENKLKILPATEKALRLKTNDRLRCSR